MASQQETDRKERNGGKRRRFFWSNMTYTTRVTISFAAIAAMTALVAIGVLSFVWEQHFRDYTGSNIQDIADTAASRLSEQYQISHTWDDIDWWPYDAVVEGSQRVEIQITSADRSILRDSTMADDDFDHQTLSLAPTDLDKTKTKSIVARDENGVEKVVGYVKVWVEGGSLLKPADKEFRDNSYQAMLIGTVIAIVLASGIGFLFARTLVRPINRMTATAKAIKEGDLSARTNLAGDDEIARLGETFDEMAESVEKDRELERRLTTDVAHELRTPLMAIQSTVEAMVDGVFAPDPDRLETLNNEVQRLGRLVDALLKLFRLENRSSPMNEQKIDVGELVDGIVETHQAFVTDSGLSIAYNFQDNVYVYGDADMLRQAVVNLVSNAVRYTPEGGRITVSVKRGDIMAAIKVQDTGIGLSPDEVKMVFSRFWRADEGRTRESGGLGIGLAVVKEIVDRHGGWVNVEGVKGEGATFTIYIPLYDEKIRKKK